MTYILHTKKQLQNVALLSLVLVSIIKVVHSSNLHNLKESTKEEIPKLTSIMVSVVPLADVVVADQRRRILFSVVCITIGYSLQAKCTYSLCTA